jgi:O-antigen ligase
MRFFLFLVVNAMLFIRPGELVPAVGDWPIYLVCISACFLVSWPAVLELMRKRHPAQPPVLACALGLLIAIPLSDLANARAELVLEHTFDFVKIVIYLVLLVSLVNTPARVRRFVGWIGAFSTVTALLATVQYHGAIEISQEGQETEAGADFATGRRRVRGGFVQENFRDPETGQVVAVQRMCGTGLFNDPNDLGLLLVTGIPIALFWLTRRELGLLRLLWLAPLALFVYALVLTHSRGSFLALLAGLGVLFWMRFGWRRSVVFGTAALPLLLALFAGRMTEISTGEGTGQSRIQLWSEGLFMFRESPFWGVGMGEYVARAQLVAHNSFIHCFAELGLFGGALFLGAFSLALLALVRLARHPERIAEVELRNMLPYLMALLTAFLVGILFLSRSYVTPTYTILGLSAAFVRVNAGEAGSTSAREEKSFRLVPRPLWSLGLASVGFLLAAETFVRVFNVAR